MKTKALLFILLTPLAFIMSMVYVLAAGLKGFCDWWWCELWKKIGS